MPFAKTGAVYTTPDVRLVVEGAGWLSDAAVTSWTVDRQLVASVIPGTIRQANGFSVGAASVSVVNTTSRVTPWSPDPSRLVRTDLPAAALEAFDEAGDTLPLGSWVLNPVTGSLASREVGVELLEAQYAGKQKPQQVPAYRLTPFDPSAPVDPIWAAARLAESAGFPATPPPVESAILALPMDGALMLTAGSAAYTASGETPGWSNLSDGTVGGESGTYALLESSAGEGGTPIATRLTVGEGVHMVGSVEGTVYVADLASGWQVEIVNDISTGTHTVGACNNGSGTFVTTTFTPTLDPAWPSRVQVVLYRAWNDTTGQWDSLTVSARSGSDATWETVTDATAHTPTSTSREEIYILGGVESVDLGIIAPEAGRFSGWQVSRVDDPALWAPAKALLQPLGGDMGMPWVPPEMSAWTAIQDLCSAWLAAAILGSDGILRVLTKEDLASDPMAATVVVAEEWVDVPWLDDPSDRHDRLEVTYVEPQVRVDGEAWRAEDVIHAPAGATLAILATLEDTAAYGLSAVVSAYGNVEGTGSPVTAYTVEVAQATATTATITYRNLSGSSQYLVTSEGEPSLALVGEVVATFGTATLTTRGKPADLAVNPLAVDLTPWVQRAQDAEAIANYLWGRLSGAAWKLSGVKCRLDWTLDIGQVRTLSHPETGLDAKVLITRVHYDGKPGEVAQSLDMVLLPWTWDDFDAVIAATPALDTWTEFDAAYAGRTWDDFDADPLWTGA